jgi:hypothetical protein
MCARAPGSLLRPANRRLGAGFGCFRRRAVPSAARSAARRREPSARRSVRPLRPRAGAFATRIVRSASRPPASAVRALARTPGCSRRSRIRLRRSSSVGFRNRNVGSGARSVRSTLDPWLRSPIRRLGSRSVVSRSRSVVSGVGLVGSAAGCGTVRGRHDDDGQSGTVWYACVRRPSVTPAIGFSCYPHGLLWTVLQSTAHTDRYSLFEKVLYALHTSPAHAGRISASCRPRGRQRSFAGRRAGYGHVAGRQARRQWLRQGMVGSHWPGRTARPQAPGRRA